MVTTKKQLYLEARRRGGSNAEANRVAGYKGNTPGAVLMEWVCWQLLREERSSWGDGPRAVEQLATGWREEAAALTQEIEERKERLREIELRLRLALS